MKSETHPTVARTSTFRHRYHSVAIAGCSVVAVAGLTAYLGAGGSPALSASYHASDHPVVDGVVKQAGTPIDGARVQVRFLELEPHLVRTCTKSHGRLRCRTRTLPGDVLRLSPWVVRHTNSTGRWSVVIPPRAEQVRLNVSAVGQQVGGAFALGARESLSTTAVFPSAGSGLLPAIFPY